MITLQNLLLRARATKNRKPFTVLARLYLGNAEGRLNDGIRRDLVYVRDLEDYDADGLPIFSAPETVRGFSGLAYTVGVGEKVIIGYDLDLEIAVLGADYSSLVEQNRIPGAVNYGDPRTKTLDIFNITPLLAYTIATSSTDSMLVTIEPYLYVDWSGTWTTFPGAAVSLSSYVPLVDDTMRLAAVFLDTTEGAPVPYIGVSTPISIFDSFASDVDMREIVESTPTGYTPIKSFKLVAGQTTLRADSEFLDMRTFHNTRPAHGTPHRIDLVTVIEEKMSTVIIGPLRVNSPLFVRGRMLIL